MAGKENANKSVVPLDANVSSNTNRQDDPLVAATARIAELEAQLAAQVSCDRYGMPFLVCKLRREGKTDKEIAEILYAKGQDNKGKWCSISKLEFYSTKTMI
ncbi:MAG: hypothetical protein LBS77_01220 [Desulfovibrio sp.]|nr:hypothetical protein [Desulfovibrio sp.]